VREGSALLQGLATCGRCGRRLRVYYEGKNSSSGYYCPGNALVNGRGSYCLRIGARWIDQAVTKTFLETITPAGIEAALAAETTLDAEHDQTLARWQLEVERLRYEAERAERRYRAVEPENRLVARGLETEWEKRLRELTTAEMELAQRQKERPQKITPEEREAIRALGADVPRVWSAPTTSDRDRKELLRTLVEEVKITLQRERFQAPLVVRWRGGAILELTAPLPNRREPPLKTDEDTVGLVRRLAAHYSDAIIAGIVNRQGRRTVRGERFTATKIGCLRRYRNIPGFQPPVTPPPGEPVTVKEAAKILEVATGTVLRWLADGFIAGEQITPGAPWRIRMTDELRAQFIDQEIEGYVPMIEATKALGVTRQTVLQRVKRGELQARHLHRGKRKGLRIKVIQAQTALFDTIA
jgi:excisionase family DNA binding protein